MRLSWAPWRHRVALAALWLFYRFLNLIGFHHSNKTHGDITYEVGEAVTAFSQSEDLMAVYNFPMTDGRVVTVMIARVRGSGEMPESAHV